MTRPTALTIAGSDCSGGAGIQADLKTMLAHGVYGMSAITALTAQNTTGVLDVMAVPPTFLANQLDMIFSDIVPDAIKIGMVSSVDLVDVISDTLRRNPCQHLVVDPVMVATSGSVLTETDAIHALAERIFPYAELITPNIPEAEVLSGISIHEASQMEQAARIIGTRYHCSVLVKGGHCVVNASDVLYAQGGQCWFLSTRIDTPNTHGTGCTLSSAIASNLALGYALPEAIRRSKSYLTNALSAGLDLGRGAGPLDHAYAIKELIL